jgi:hypothetical protein
MIADNTLFLIFGILVLVCLLIFIIPVLFVRYYHPALDEPLLAIIDKGSRVFFILLIIALFIWGYFWNNLDLATILMMWPIILMGMILPIIVCYRELYTLANPLTDEQLKDLRVRELDLSLPYHQAFILCKNAIDTLDATDFTDKKKTDSDSGIISIEALPLYNLTSVLKWPTLITISLNETDDAITHVKISGITPKATVELIPGRIPSRLNEEYVNRITYYLLGKKPGNENDDSPPIINA